MQNDGKKPNTNADQEAILIALDQLSQTMEVMTQVVSRLKRTVEQARFTEENHRQTTEPAVKQPMGRQTTDYVAKALQQYNQRRQQSLAQPNAEAKKKPTVKAPIILH